MHTTHPTEAAMPAPTTTAQPYDVTVPPVRRERPGLAPSLVNPAWTAGQEAGRGGWYAQIRFPEGAVLEVSRLDGESTWTIDAATTGRGLPLFRNGYGARYLLTKVLKAETAARLDALTGADR